MVQSAQFDLINPIFQQQQQQEAVFSQKPLTKTTVRYLHITADRQS